MSRASRSLIRRKRVFRRPRSLRSFDRRTFNTGQAGLSPPLLADGSSSRSISTAMSGPGFSRCCSFKALICASILRTCCRTFSPASLVSFDMVLRHAGCRTAGLKPVAAKAQSGLLFWDFASFPLTDP